MKWKIFVLLVFLSASSVAQSSDSLIIKKVFTNKGVYVTGETVLITIRAINKSSNNDTLVFPDLCEAYPVVDNNDYLWTFRLGCFTAISEVIIPAMDSVEWSYEWPRYTHPDLTLEAGQHYVYGYFQDFSANSDTIGFFIKDGVPSLVENPKFVSFKLSQNYPNPFNPTTTIKYSISQASFVELKVLDIFGNEVKILVGEQKEKGSYTIKFDASGLSSGVYFYKLKSNHFSEIKKLLLLR